MLKLCAERRWVMSGTPARLTSPHDALRSLHGLLRFLRHPLGMTGAGLAEWRAEYAGPIERAIERGDGDGDAAACVERLHVLLRSMMVRHRKEEAKVPPPVRLTTRLECSAEERLAYNVRARRAPTEDAEDDC